MKKVLLFVFAVAILIACNDDNSDDASVLEAFGTVITADGVTKIVLDNGETVFPANASDFDMQADTRVKIEYKVLLNRSDNSGTDCTILNVERVECKSYVDLYFYNIDSLKRDPVKINEVSLDDDCLVVNLSYGGGCEDHIVDLARIHPSCGTPPLPPPTFEIRHDSKDDPCDAWLTETHSFDLSSLTDEFKNDVKIVFWANEGNDNVYKKELTIKID